MFFRPHTSPEERIREKFKISCLTLIIGATIILYLAISGQRHAYLVKHGVRTIGTVIGCAASETSPQIAAPNRNILQLVSYKNYCYEYKVEFITDTGKTVDFMGGPNTLNASSAGKVAILYSPSDPQNTATIDDAPSIFFLIVGVFFCVISLLFFKSSLSEKV